MTINDTFQEIATITQQIIEYGLSVEERWPDRTGSKISWQDQRDVSVALKNMPYSEKYEILRSEGNFNFKMLDGALVQMMYEFNSTGRELQSHRLAFFPSPTLERFDSSPSAYEEQYFGESEFHDMMERNVVAFPLRFDYNSRHDLFIEIDHPYSHATFGEFETCRIPANGPFTPSIFMHFILRNFYNYAFRAKGAFCKISKFRFEPCITETEQGLLHFNIH